jgi:hypothetical protein
VRYIHLRLSGRGVERNSRVGAGETTAIQTRLQSSQGPGKSAGGWQYCCVHMNGADRALSGSKSPEWEIRRASGQWLAANVHVNYRPDLIRLLNDGENTAVSMGTAWALLERQDALALSVVLAALSTADDETLNHILPVIDVHIRGWPPEATHLLDECRAMQDEAVQAGLVVWDGGEC